MSQTQRVAFVCSGNICRSPMAAVIARQLFEERDQPAAIISVGTLDLVGKPAAAHARAAVAEIGLDLEGHRSQPATPSLLRFADHIVVMAPRHVTELRARDPRLMSQIVRLWEHYSEEAEGAPLTQIEDPVGQDLGSFRRCRDIIQACLTRWVDDG